MRRVGGVSAGELRGPALGVAERRLGVSLAGTHLQSDAAADQRLRGEGALAAAQGSQVGFRRGLLETSSTAGANLVGHELVHVAQQRRAGRSVTQRQPAGEKGKSTAAEGSKGKKKPLPKPSGTTLDFQFKGNSYPLADDQAYLEAVLRRSVEDTKEHDAAGKFASAFASMAHAQIGGGGTSGSGQAAQTRHDTDLLQAIEKTLPTALSAVRSEQTSIIEDFDTVANATFDALLLDHEQRIEAERLRYGVTEHTGAAYGPGLPNKAVKVHEMEDNVQTAGMVAAAKELHEKSLQLQGLYTKQAPYIRKGGGEGSGPTPEPGAERLRAIEEDITRVRRELEILRASVQARYPILASFDPATDTEIGRGTTFDAGLAEVATGTPGQVAGALHAQIEKKLENIYTVRDGLSAQQITAWEFDQVIALALRAKGYAPNTFEAIVVVGYKSDLAADKALVEMAYAILALSLAVIAAAPTGGASLAIAGVQAAATVGSVALSIRDLNKDLEEYRLKSAAADTNFDRARSVSREEPSMFWLALSIVGVVADVGDAITAFRGLSRAVRTGIEAVDDAELTKALAAIDEAAGGGKLAGVAEDAKSTVRRLRGAKKGALPEEVLAGARGYERRALKEASEKLAKSDSLGKGGTSVLGHKVKVVPPGTLVFCSGCHWISGAFAKELLADPALERRFNSMYRRARKAWKNGDKVLADKTAQEAAALIDDLVIARRLAGKQMQLKAGPKLSMENLQEVLDGMQPAPKQWEIDAVTKAAKSGDIWELPDVLRGKVGHALMGENLPYAFKTIDFVAQGKNGIATEIRSFKTRDLTLGSFAEPMSLFESLRLDIAKVRGFGTEAKSGVMVVAGPDTKRVLEVGLNAKRSSAEVLKSKRTALFELMGKSTLSPEEAARFAQLDAEIKLILQHRRELAAAQAHGARVGVQVMYKGI